ncbi:malonyl-CoA:anthocyanidin 5-O-glucoside-6''-O-malonyltransferase-like [Musa acuminata AAA Group]|uniref:malonyl-CoA:anthocyanidin 5-O-glucoside-6''-O-malonyltransferase-like n=1 Tax=Musa acuminata AAA Group TaxID=214697 RepID=UPI0031D15B65
MSFLVEPQAVDSEIDEIMAARLLPFPTLLHYFPLAGELTYLLYSGNVVIDCSPAANGPGVAFLEADAEGDLGLLANAEVHDHSVFLRLVPELDVRELPAPLFAVQVTRFCWPQGVDSVAVGFAAHPAVVDGRALWRFVEAWTAECRGDRTGGYRTPEEPGDSCIRRRPTTEVTAAGSSPLAS